MANNIQEYVAQKIIQYLKERDEQFIKMENRIKMFEMQHNIRTKNIHRYNNDQSHTHKCTFCHYYIDVNPCQDEYALYCDNCDECICGFCRENFKEAEEAHYEHCTTLLHLI